MTLELLCPHDNAPLDELGSCTRCDYQRPLLSAHVKSVGRDRIAEQRELLRSIQEPRHRMPAGPDTHEVVTADPSLIEEEQ